MFVGACNGFFIGINRHTGDVLWRYDIRADGDQAGFHGRSLVADDLVIVATDGRAEGFVYAFEQTTGRVRWKHHVGRPVPSDVVRRGQLVYVLTRDDSLLALDFETGIVRWRFAQSNGSQFEVFVSSPTIVGNLVVMAARNGVVYALDASTGGVAWQHDLGAGLTTPAATMDLVYVGIVNENRVVALSVASGSPRGEARIREPLAAFEHPVVAGGGVAIITGSRLELWAADLARVVWHGQGPARFGRPPVLWGDRLLTGTVRGHVLGYSVSDGGAELTATLTGVVTGVHSFGEMLYIGTQEGTLYALRP